MDRRVKPVSGPVTIVRGGAAACALLLALTFPATASDPIPTDWRKVATSADRARLRGWRTAWISALAKARASGSGAAIAAQGVLFDPDRALQDPMPPVGDYRCRTFKLGGKAAGMLDYVPYPAFSCRIAAEGSLLSFYKIGGSQRPVGLFFDADRARGVFLGTMLLGDETRTIGYGRDRNRDLAGFVERIEPRRWRVVLPYPAFESTLDIIELVPAH